MSVKAYLTIDDSPSTRTDDLVDFLTSKDIPALLYCRGDSMKTHMSSIVRAIQKGFVIGNHSYGHQPAGDLSFEEWVADFERAERLIEEAYKQADVKRYGLYHRFAYIDRGDGDRIERRFPDLIAEAGRGENPSLPENRQVQAIQNFLKERGFSQPFENINHPLYQVPQIRDAADSFFTYSTCDWMLTERHLQNDQWPHKAVADLTSAMDVDPFLWNEGSTQIILVHDQPEIFDEVLALITHMVDKGMVFQAI